MRCWAWRLGLVLLCGPAGVVATRAQALAAGATISGSATLIAGPAVTAISPNNGPASGGTLVTVSGEGFLAGSTVTVGGAAATSVAVNSSTSITVVIPAGDGTAEVRVSNSNGASGATPKDQFAYDSPPSGPWLGLNGNSSTYLGPIDTFVDHDIVFDRGGPIEWTAGEPLAEAGKYTEGGEG